MDVKPVKKQGQDAGQELEFVVMPKPQKPSARPPLPPSGLPPSGPKAPKSWVRFALYGLLAVLVLAAAAVFAYQKFDQTNKAVKIFKKKPPEIVLEKPASGPDADQDGLSLLEEQQHGTDPGKADSDGDGLADGDEVKIYESDPLLPDTDGDGFDDGQEVARGFSPLVSSPEKAHPEEIAKWSQGIAEFGLHEPTPATLKLKALPAAEQSKTLYQNSLYGYQIELPGLLTLREQDNGQQVGIYPAGTTAELDADVLTDPIALEVAVKVEGQTLEEWISSQYQPIVDYEKLENLEINALKAVRLRGMPGQACPQDRTFFPKNGVIIIATWTCNQLVDFGQFYQEIIESFKFE